MYVNTPETANASTKHKKVINQPVRPKSAALLRLSPSTCYRQSIILLHLASMVSIGLAALPIILQLVFIVISFASLYRHVTLMREMPTFYVHQCSAEQWVLQSENNRCDFLKIESCYYLSSWLIILRLKPEDSAHPLQSIGSYYPVFRDSCNQDQFRHVYILAKYFLVTKAS